MKIRSLKIKNWYVLKDFEITLDKNISVLIGENGSGKSSLLEAIALIFGHLRKYFIDGDKNADFISGYVINFESFVQDNKYEVEIHSIGYQDDIDDKGVFNYRLKIKGKELELKQANAELKTIGGFSKLLPEEIVIYYSGYTDRLYTLSNYFEEKYRKKVTKSDNKYTLKPLNFPQNIPFFYSNPKHLSMILLSLLISSKDAHKKFLSEYIGDIDLTEAQISINLKKPSWARSISTSFWGAHDSIIKDFLSHLQSYSDDHIFEEERIQLTYDSIYPLIDLMHFLIEDNEEQFLYRMLYLLYYNELLDNIDITWKNGIIEENIELDRISEGQKQILSTLGLISLLEQNNVLFLLDEPDTFLHPKWQINFIKQIEQFASNQIILTTHSSNMLNHMNSDIYDLSLFHKGQVDINVPKENFGKTIAYINYNLMGIEERPKEIQRQLDDLFISLEDEDIEKASKVYSTLLSKIGEDDSDMKKAKIELEYIKSVK